MPVIIDGYNLLRMVQKCDEDLAGLNELGLCKVISEYLSQIRNRGHIIFDGTGPPDKNEMEALGGIGNLEVYFSGPRIDADGAIEEKISDSSAPKSLTVVSSDRRLRSAASKRKAISLRSEVFWQIVVRQLQTQSRPSVEPGEKRRGLTESETDKWMDYFGFDK